MNTRQSTSNGFAQGLMMDYHISGVPNNALSNALNATFVTYNGNEAILQNDLGNGRVESAYLPEGFVPLGTTSFGGIIYIVSYNPLEDVCQIGSFPSPERNFTQNEDGNGTFSIFLKELNANLNKSHQLVIPLINPNTGEEIRLTSGDKFALNIKDLSKYFGYLVGMQKNFIEAKNDPCIQLCLGIRRDGQIRELSNIYKYDTYEDKDVYNYISLSSIVDNGKIQSIDEYRNLIESPYNIVNCNISGTLCIIVKIVTLDTFNETHKILGKK